MSPLSLQNGEVQYYASPILVKNNRYNATITNIRIIFEGNVTREFRVANIIAAYPEMINDKEPGIKLVLATPTGQKEMLWSFPLDDVFKKGEQEAWLTAIKKTAGDKPFTEGDTAPITAVESISAVQTANVENSNENTVPNLIRGETVIISTGGVQIKHSFYTAYLTNLRFILVNNTGKVGREFAIAELKDAAELESETGNAEIAISVGMQSGLKQMILIYPTRNARDAWMRELQAKLPHHQAEKKEDTSIADRIGTFTPATNERILISTPNVKIKNRPMVVHLTNTRFIIDSSTGIMGEFAINSLSRAVRISSELGEPGISVTIGSPSSRKDMHLIFLSMNDREAWMDQLHTIIPEEEAVLAPTTAKYTVTSVEPQRHVNTQSIACPKCGSFNPSSDEYCAMCGADLHAPAKSSKRERDSRPPKEPKMPKESRGYDGNISGFLFRPKDAFIYHAHESPKMAILFSLLTGLIWAAITTLIIAFVLPNIINLDSGTFPILTEIQNNPVMFILILLIFWGLWFVGVLVHAAFAGLVGQIVSEESNFVECMTIVMRSSMAYAVCGWIPVIGLIGAAIWTGISSWWGMRETQGMSGIGAGICAFVGIVVVYVVIIVIGVI